MSETPRPQISVVIPTLNEEANVIDMVEAVNRALGVAEVSSYELLFIDNGSDDGTVPLVKQLCAQDSRIRLISNTRNFGQMRSPTYGIYQARGEAVIAMCADFQDPPELLPELIRRWREGQRIVLGVREAESNSLMFRTVRGLAYRFLNRFGDYPVVPEATGFGLYDRRVVDTLAKWNEPEPFFRGMLVETGFSLVTVPYRRPLRSKGKSKNNPMTLLSFAMSGLASSSKNLLRLPLFFAAAVLSAALLLLVLAGFAAIGQGPALPLLFASLVTFGFALIFLFLGLLGEQVRLISERTRGTQLVIERERVNF